MAVTRKDYELVYGCTWSKNFSITNKSDSSAVNITGSKFYLTVKSDKDDADVDAEFQKTGVITDAAGGLFTLSFGQPDSDLIGCYFYDIRWIKSDGSITTIVMGEFNFIKNVTDATT